MSIPKEVYGLSRQCIEVGYSGDTIELIKLGRKISDYKSAAFLFAPLAVEGAIASGKFDRVHNTVSYMRDVLVIAKPELSMNPEVMNSILFSKAKEMPRIMRIFDADDVNLVELYTRLLTEYGIALDSFIADDLAGVMKAMNKPLVAQLLQVSKSVSGSDTFVDSYLAASGDISRISHANPDMLATLMGDASPKAIRAVINSGVVKDINNIALPLAYMGNKEGLRELGRLTKKDEDIYNSIDMIAGNEYANAYREASTCEHDMWYACRDGKFRMVRRLYEVGVPVSDEMMRMACFNGHVDVFKYLLMKDSNLLHSIDESELTLAGLNGYVNMVQYLFELGISTEKCKRIADKKGRHELVQYLNSLSK